MIQRVLIAGGGTGGHLFPGIAVAEELQRRGPVEVTWVGTDRGIESRILPARGERFEVLDVTPLKGRGPVALARSVGRLPVAAARAGALLRELKPDLVLGLGGYVAGPLLLAASGAGVPTAILEQNARVGLTNRLLSRAVDRAYLSFPETAAGFPDGRARVPGNPVRRAFVMAARRVAADPEGAEARARHVLVVGGSQGAQVLNEIVPEALLRADLQGLGWRVLHQTGAAMQEAVADRYRALGLDADVVSFIDDMAGAYVDSALVICRAGATSVAELCAIGRPAVLVPYPHAADDHQRKNAEALADDGAAICLPQDRLGPETLGPEVARLLGEAPVRQALAAGARRRGRPDAAAAVVDDLVAWLGAPPGDRPRSGSRTRRRPLLDATPSTPSREALAGPTRPGRLRGERPYVPELGYGPALEEGGVGDAGHVAAMPRFLD